MKTIIFLFIILLGSKFMHCQTTITPQQDINLALSGSWKEVVYDEFNYTDENRWLRWTGINAATSDAPPQPGQASWDLPENVYCSNGNLSLDVVKLSSSQTFGPWWCSDAYPNQSWSFDYTSAAVVSKQFFGYGKYEASIQVPKGKGYYSSFWLYGEVFNYNEIDIFEMHKKDNYSLVHTNVHYPDVDNNEPDHHCPNGYYFGAYYPENSFCWGGATDFSNGFHHWELIWEPYKLVWKVDGITLRGIYKYYDDEFYPVYDGILHHGKTYSINSTFPEGPVQVIFALSIDGTSGWLPDTNTQFPNSLLVEWFKYSVHDRDQVNINQQNNPALNTSNAYNLFTKNQFDPSWNVIVGTDINISTNITIGRGSYEIIAKNSITLGPGFQVLPVDAAGGKVKPDWNFRAYIDPSSNTSSRLSYTPVFDKSIDTLQMDYNNIENKNAINLTEKQNENNEVSDILTEKTIKISNKIDIKIYPNPNIGKFEIDFNCVNFNDYKIVIFNSLNIIVYQTTFVSSNPFTIDLQNFSKDVYFLYIINQKENKKFMNKLILQ